MEALAFDPELAGFDGIGFVVQAYQKRCPFVIDYLVDLAQRSGRKFMVRLVKGAYWDSEIKRAQVDGMPGYPVYTRKVAHRRVLPGLRAKAARPRPTCIYPQFATHNAHIAGGDLHRGAGATASPTTNSSACTAWARRCTTRWSVRPTSTGRAASTPRSARTRRCWPTWCGGCWKTAPIPRSSTRSSTNRCRSKR